MVELARGVQQGCNLGPLCYSAGSLKIPKEFRANPPVPGARAVSFIDDITVILPPELSLDMAAIGKVTEWLQERLGVEGISLNRTKSRALLADGLGSEQLTEEQRVAMDTTKLTVVRQGMRVVGVPVGTEQFQRDFLQEAVNGEPAELVRALVPMEDAQASFQILRLSATSPLSHLLRTVPPSITYQAEARRFSGVGVGVYHSWRRSCRGRATNARGSSPPSRCVPKSDLPGARRPTAGPPANPRRRPWTYQQQLHQRRGIYRLPRPGPGACRRCLRPAEPSVPS